MVALHNRVLGIPPHDIRGVVDTSPFGFGSGSTLFRYIFGSVTVLSISTRIAMIFPYSVINQFSVIGCLFIRCWRKLFIKHPNMIRFGNLYRHKMNL